MPEMTITPERLDSLVESLSDGMPLIEWCRLNGLTKTKTYKDIAELSESDRERIAHAREVGYDKIAMDCLTISDDSSEDVRIFGKEGEEREVLNTEFVQRAKLRIETRLKLLAKWSPKRYGDRQEVAHTGGITVTAGQLDEKL